MMPLVSASTAITFQLVKLVLMVSVEFNIPYILESNPHPFYSCRGLKSQMQIRFAI
jgi:hypothetical protein